jgi:CelD/BcsL family acetyltransferase involved in cellulose biosynthesis
MLSCDVVKVRDLSQSDAQIWDEMVLAEPAFASPLLTRDFAAAVAAVRDDVRVAVFRRKGRAVGFLSHHRRPQRFARPAGAPFADYSALISFAEPGFRFDDALRAAGIERFQAIGLIDPHGLNHEGGGEADMAFGLDLGDDAPAIQAPKKHVKNINRLRRRLEEAHGPVSILVGDRDRTRYQAMLAQKRRQLQDNGLHDFLGAPWAARFLDHLWDAPQESAHGVLLTLMAGDTPILHHYGLRLGARVHPWVSSYDPAYATWSPGQIFLHDAPEALRAAGVTHYDLSTGQDHYKNAFCNTQFPVRHVRLYGASAAARLRRSVAEAAHGGARLLGQRAESLYGRLNRRLDQIAALELDMKGRMSGLAYAFANADRRKASLRGGADAG